MICFYKVSNFGKINEDVEKIAEYKDLNENYIPNIGEKIVIKTPYKVVEKVFFIEPPNEEVDIEIFCAPCNLMEEWGE